MGQGPAKPEQCWWECGGTAAAGNSPAVPQKVKHRERLHVTQQFCSDTHPENQARSLQNLYTELPTVSVFIIAKKKRETTQIPIKRGMDKINWDTHTMNYYTKRN